MKRIELSEELDLELREHLKEINQYCRYDDIVKNVIGKYENCESLKALGFRWFEFTDYYKDIGKNRRDLLWRVIDFEKLGQDLVSSRNLLWQSEYIWLKKSKVVVEVFTW